MDFCRVRDATSTRDTLVDGRSACSLLKRTRMDGLDIRLEESEHRLGLAADRHARRPHHACGHPGAPRAAAAAAHRRLLPGAHLRRPLGRRTHPGAQGPTRVPHGARETPGTDVPVFRAPDRGARAASGSVNERPAGRLPPPRDRARTPPLPACRLRSARVAYPGQRSPGPRRPRQALRRRASADHPRRRRAPAPGGRARRGEDHARRGTGAGVRPPPSPASSSPPTSCPPT